MKCTRSYAQMVSALLLLGCSAGSSIALASNATFGRTFGTGLAGIRICEQPAVVLNYTLSPTATHGVVHHFWATGAQIAIDTAYIDYYIDGEMSPSISMQPAMMCGLAFPKEFIAADKTHLYTAGSACGKNAPVGGWFNTYPIPFSKSILVLVRSSTPTCSNGYINIRGTEDLPVILPGGLPLPNNARLHLQKNNWAVRQPLEYINITSMPSGTKGMVFQSTLAVETQPVGGAHAGGGYIEGCWHFYREHDEEFPGMVVGTGVEDYFDSGYYFGADSGIPNADPFTAGLSGLPLFQRTDDGVERFSAYRFHNHDPLVFTDGGALLWRVGAKGLPGTSKCGNKFPVATGPLPPTPAPVPAPPEPVRPPQPSPSPAPPPMKRDGCADGMCDSFCSNANVVGCLATWEGEINVRAPTTGAKCGGSLGKCSSLADACSDGWEICLGNVSNKTKVDVAGFATAMTAEECASGDPRKFVGGMSHSNPKYEHIKAASPCPPNGTKTDNTCLTTGWGCEPICCGESCVVPSCPDEIWFEGTRIHVDMRGGCCGSLTSGEVDGVLCCKIPPQNTSTQQQLQHQQQQQHHHHQQQQQQQQQQHVDVALGRQLTPINMTSYGWVYTWD